MIGMRSIVGVTTAVAVAIGFAVGWWLRAGGDPMPPAATAVTQRTHAPPADFDAMLAEIRTDLAFERDARVAFAEKMRRELDRLHALSEWRPPARSAPDVANAEEPSSPNIDLESELAGTWFSEAALIERGFPAGEIARLRERFEEMELEKRYLRDYAIREGWITSSRYTDALREMRQELHTSLGDEDYDKVLYATGRSNRVRVSDVLQGSPATAAGIRRGDVIVRYAGNRVFDPTALYISSTQGKAGAPTEIEVLRNGEIIHLFVPRGPLGTQFSHDRVPPGS